MVRSLWSQHGALNHIPSQAYLLGRSQHFELLISPGTLYCRVDRGSMGWEVCPTLLHMSSSAPLLSLPTSTLSVLSFALPPSVKHGWLLLCHHQSNTVDFTLPPSVNHDWFLPFPPSANHSWLVHCHHQSIRINYCLATISQTRLTFALPPVSRTPCPFVPNVLDIQNLRMRAIYIVNFSWMKIAVCKQVSGSLISDIVYTWKLTQSWKLYHLCNSITILISKWHYLIICSMIFAEVAEIIIMFSWAVARLY